LVAQRISNWYKIRFKYGLKCRYISFQASEELEDRESLAVIAAQEGQDSNETVGPDGETFMEKYTRGVSAVETILTLDR